jgi:hypothetical protein
LASINSVRHHLVALGCVVAVDHVAGIGTAKRTRWGLAR